MSPLHLLRGTLWPVENQTAAQNHTVIKAEGPQFLRQAPSWRTARRRGCTPGKEAAHPLSHSGHSHGLPGMKCVCAGQDRRQLSTPPTLLQDSWARGEALARERHLPISEEREDTTEGLRGPRWRLSGAGRARAWTDRDSHHPPSWWEGAGGWQGPVSTWMCGDVGLRELCWSLSPTPAQAVC